MDDTSPEYSHSDSAPETGERVTGGQVALTPPLRLTFREYQGVMPGGWTAPHSIGAFAPDGREYRLVMKLREPASPIGEGHYGGTSLACELIFAVLARALGMRGPDYAIVEVTAPFANSVGDPAARALLMRNIGANFGTVHLAGYGDWDPHCSRSSEDLHDALEDVLTYDAAIYNADRSAAKPNLLWDGLDDVRVIDHGLAAAVSYLYPEAALEAEPFLPDNRVQSHCAYLRLFQRARSYRSLLATWAAIMDDTNWRALRSYIPGTWERQPGDLDRLFGFLSRRSARFEPLNVNLRRVLR